MDRTDLLVQIARTATPIVPTRLLVEDLREERWRVLNELRTLEDTGHVKQVELKYDIGWILNQESYTVDGNGFSATANEDDGFCVRFRDNERNANVLVQAGRDGYQLDAWWRDEKSSRNHASNWIRYSDERGEPSYTNTHNRPGAVTIDDEIMIVDSEPHHVDVGYEPTIITITRCDSGYEVTLTWTDPYGDEQTARSILPLVDPRNNREQFYELLNQQSTIPDPTTG